jgi:hypothetical protein
VRFSSTISSGTRPREVRAVVTPSITVCSETGRAIEPLTPGAAYLEQAASDADQLAAEAIASSTRAAYESDFRDFPPGAASLVWTRCQRRPRQ